MFERVDLHCIRDLHIVHFSFFTLFEFVQIIARNERRTEAEVAAATTTIAKGIGSAESNAKTKL